MRLARVRPLRAADDVRADDALRVAAERLRSRAGAIEEAELRAKFLAVPEHAQTLTS